MAAKSFVYRDEEDVFEGFDISDLFDKVSSDHELSNYEDDNESSLNDVILSDSDSQTDQFETLSIALFDEHADPNASPIPEKPNFPCSSPILMECAICFDEKMLRKRLCCMLPVCDHCMQLYLEEQVSRRNIKIECINTKCISYIHRDEILERLSLKQKEKYYMFLVDANNDPCVKTCPRCNHVQHIEKSILSSHKDKFGLSVTCPVCDLQWCFVCHAPWHVPLPCSEFQNGDKLLKDWAKEFRFGKYNARKCPKCKVYIERNGGCDHMRCNQCYSTFCYRCGGRYYSLKYFGSHTSRFSPFGCKYKLYPDKPVRRRLIRGSVLGGKILAAIGLLGLGVAAGVILLGASVVILPIYGGVKYHRRRQMRKLIKERLERRRELELQMNSEMGFYLSYFSPKPRDDLNRGVILSGRLDLRPPEPVKVDDSTSIHVLDTEEEQVLRSVQPLKVKVNGKCKDTEGCITVTSAEVEQGEGPEIILHVKTSYSQNKNPLDLPDKDDTESVTEDEEPRGSQLSDTDSDSKDGDNSEESEEETSKIDSSLEKNSPNPGCFMNLFGKKLNSLQHKKSIDKGIVMSKGDHSDKQNPTDIPVEFLECPDIVTSALEAEFKNSQDGRLYQQDLVIDCKEEKKDDHDGESDGVTDLPCVFSNTGDPYSGLVATETCSTSL
ncbi:hypothetical protein ACJMK2_000856 [Sinanodonta woodiana]|uniref:RBR-type E3 ubiquitin transferase n=1 Tax=Sinanodonta woodiana TaxID=1069815 RepID=A0ABD3XQH8_SINWO